MLAIPDIDVNEIASAAHGYSGTIATSADAIH